ncbi:putative quinol monooxygenase [Mucilaginibacter sp. 22184]|uniref:putative quinol monooxygenase n=1 Tax=Mucilaginibacter sp. 22184 TaxID=3453887 RepID=UPI003F868ADF
MEQQQFTVIADLTALTGFEQEILELIKELVAICRKQPEVLYYSSSEVIAEPGRFVFFEVYHSKEAFEINKNADHTQHFFKAVQGKLKGDGIKATFLEEVKVTQ